MELLDLLNSYVEECKVGSHSMSFFNPEFITRPGRSVAYNVLRLAEVAFALDSVTVAKRR